MDPVDEATYAGDLFTAKPDESTFNSLYAAKRNGQQVYGRKRGFMAVDHNRVMTPDTFRMLERDIDSVVTKGHKGKQRYVHTLLLKDIISHGTHNYSSLYTSALQ